MKGGACAALEDNHMADKSITKTELVASIASATGQSQSAVSGVLDSLFSTISEAVAKGSKVTIPGWLAVERVETSARTGRNPQTGAEIKIPAGQRVKVTAGSKLKAAVK
jgi:DNA-binding protein HU-beta